MTQEQNIRLIAGMVLAGILFVWSCGKTEPPASSGTTKTAETVKTQVLPHTITDAELGQKVKCPVMGDEFTVTKFTPSLEYKGKVYYFCCGGCPEEFKANPDKFAR
ncbi:MAG: YHS domain-containing protein [Planctomycetota bacterium]